MNHYYISPAVHTAHDCINAFAEAKEAQEYKSAVAAAVEII